MIVPPYVDEDSELKVVGTLGEALAGWRSATRTRIDDTRGNRGRQDYHLEATQDRRDMVDQARKLERTNALAEALLSRSVENVVGTGWPLQALSGDPRWNATTEERWKDWATFHCDARGISTFSQKLQLHQRGKLRDGDSFSLFLDNGTLQAIESDQVSTPFGLRQKLVDGIELDDLGKPISYHVITRPDPLQTTVRLQPSTKIPAELIVPLARRQRHGQTRGLTAFANSFWLLEQMDGQIKAATVAARMAACVGLVLNNKSRMAGLRQKTDGRGDNRRQLRLEPGFILERVGEETVTQVDPSKPVDKLPETVQLMARLAGLPFGLPLEISLMFWEKSNFSQARGALLQAHSVWQCEQVDLERFASRIYRWWIIREMEAGTIPIRGDALTHRWLKPAWKYLNPKEEILADLARVDAGVGTLSELTRRQGHEFADVVAIRKMEKALLDEAGLSEVRSTMTRDPVPPAQDPPPPGTP